MHVRVYAKYTPNSLLANPSLVTHECYFVWCLRRCKQRSDNICVALVMRISTTVTMMVVGKIMNCFVFVCFCECTKVNSRQSHVKFDICIQTSSGREMRIIACHCLTPISLHQDNSHDESLELNLLKTRHFV